MSESAAAEGDSRGYLHLSYFHEFLSLVNDLFGRSITIMVSGVCHLPTMLPGRPGEPKMFGRERRESPSLCSNSALPCKPRRGFSVDDCMASPSFSAVSDFSPAATVPSQHEIRYQ
jgi:hypothetical protein